MPELDFGSLIYMATSEKTNRVITKEDLIENLLSLKKKPIEIYMTVYLLKNNKCWRGKRGIKGIIKQLNLSTKRV